MGNRHMIASFEKKANVQSRHNNDEQVRPQSNSLFVRFFAVHFCKLKREMFINTFLNLRTYKSVFKSPFEVVFC